MASDSPSPENSSVSHSNGGLLGNATVPHLGILAVQTSSEHRQRKTLQRKPESIRGKRLNEMNVHTQHFTLHQSCTTPEIYLD